MKMRSFLAKYRSTDGKPLIGDVLVSESCRYQRRTEAERRLSHVKELNGPHCEGEIVPSQQHPEILIHCGKVPQAIGGKCFSCGKVLTVEDAKKAEPEE